MHPLLIFVALAVNALPITEVLRAQGSVDYFDPRERGGSLLDNSAGLGEPLNVIISGKSSPQLLTPSGFLDYAQAIGFSDGCLGINSSGRQQANLGDGRGLVDEMGVFRQSFGIPGLGSCLEVLTGGNHFRVWKQDGPDANSGALFLAVSQEENLAHKHTIAPDGYNIGRCVFLLLPSMKGFIHFSDKFVEVAKSLKRYTTTIQDITNLLEPGSQGVNHGISQDGIVKLLTITVS
ncbi:hypothetical protein K443DRAFT_127192 [Laccaria amethystina LaAM-08-1]|uniref:Uncharacterized protein n=1 Tax=Laccaria amethystina LaAM-08-1 TaxID=1095629 RepID=A0A0C9Y6Y9_9AGAR|nr:hypothetical protein K443DRAFT_127192 [Laccaria amethystina LaAM-08-1]